MNCIICNQEIENDSQFINGNWYHNKCIENQQKEIERLNNIINELEKELDIAYRDLFYGELVNGRDLITNIKAVLQELKESEK